MNFKYSWEEAIEILRNDPLHTDLIHNSYITRNVFENAERFSVSEEFADVLLNIKKYHTNAHDILDVPAGNGIASYSFAVSGFKVVAVEPNPSETLGRGAINSLINKYNISIDVYNNFGESLPFDDSSFDIVYVRQGLHHANDLNLMLLEYKRVLRPNGLLFACREHVVDDYNDSLNKFLNSQPDHLLYGGEYAYTLNDYLNAINGVGLEIIKIIKPYDSVINSYPNSVDALCCKILNRIPRFISKFIPSSAVKYIIKLVMNYRKNPGRLYSFIAKK